MKSITYFLGCILACTAQAQPPLGSTLEQTATQLKANPALWPVLGFVDPSDKTPDTVQKRALLDSLRAQMQADYSKALAGRLTRGSEGYYTDVSQVLYEKGGYSNWHLAQVLDFRVAYSIADRTYQTGVATVADRRLLSGISQRTLNARVLSNMVAEAADKEVAAPLAGMTTEEAFNQAAKLIPGAKDDWPPSMDPSVLKQKSFPRLLMRLWVHETLVDLSFRPLLDAVAKVSDWNSLGREQRAAAILANVALANYSAIGVGQPEARHIEIMQGLLTDANSVFHILGRE